MAFTSLWELFEFTFWSEFTSHFLNTTANTYWVLAFPINPWRFSQLNNYISDLISSHLFNSTLSISQSMISSKESVHWGKKKNLGKPQLRINCWGHANIRVDTDTSVSAKITERKLWYFMEALYGELRVWWLKPWVWPTVVAGRQVQKQRSAAGSPLASAKSGLSLTS